jgi:hypothetical protein
MITHKGEAYLFFSLRQFVFSSVQGHLNCIYSALLFFLGAVIRSLAHPPSSIS